MDGAQNDGHGHDAPSVEGLAEPQRFPRKRADRARMTTRPGTMKQNPPRRAPRQPRSRQAQKMANCVDAGPGSRLQAAMPSSNSPGVIHSRSTTHSFRSRAMWVGGPPNPMHPMRPHSRAMVVRRTGSPAACMVKKARQTRAGEQSPGGEHRQRANREAWGSGGAVGRSLDDKPQQEAQMRGPIAGPGSERACPSHKYPLRPSLKQLSWYGAHTQCID